MSSKGTRLGGWDGAIPALSEEGLLLAEMTHRVNNELSAAIAAVSIVRSGRPGVRRDRMLAAASERLDGFAGVVRALMVPPSADYDLTEGMVALCNGLCAARDGVDGSLVSLDIPQIRVDGATARRIMMVAAELIGNAIRHALEHRGGTLAVILRRDEHELRLAVMDDGPGIGSSTSRRGAGMGRPIVRELIDRAGGTLSCQTGPKGTKVRVALPLAAEKRTEGAWG